jgi:hypothetical protein
LDQNRKVVVIGSSGNISLQLQKNFPLASIISRRQYDCWENASQLSAIFKDQLCDIYVAIGVLSSKAKISELVRVNLQIPKLVAESIKGTESRVITFGSIMEKEERIFSSNAYIGTKKKLSEFLLGNLHEKNFLHLRLHTLYGGSKLNTEMFLGQLFRAIKYRSKFQMSSGRQVREYHHIEDDLKALELLQSQGYTGIQEISHEEAFTLKEIAKQVFDHFEVPDLLVVGGKEDSLAEIFSPIGKRTNALRDFHFRPSIEGINSYLSLYATLEKS